LDLCCGTGDIAAALARSCQEVVGLDFSPEMLALAERKSSPNLRYITGDAQCLPFKDNSHDIITVGYGLRNLADWEVGLAEMRRVAKPGGRLIVLEFGRPANAVWRSFYFGYLKLFVPVLGHVFCGSRDAYAYILESLRQYPGQEAVAARMRELGLKDVKIINLAGGAMSINFGVKA
jgi:demethylmenaquinone methyltransferase/2-methoxy-6-polyprenyl-1,4-benzoquinol methylase